MDYGTVRSIHLACVTVSITLFVLRGLLQIASVNWRQWRWLRIVPHLNDTVLLAAAITLSVMSGQYPLAQPWLSAKVLALLVYVAAGSMALRPGLSPARQRSAFGVALLTVAYIVGVAWTRSPTLGLR
ncbi:MAG: SirB2 family protein [Polaromonas sp.]|nr:SirB2 family protein [Polaromonas sp.]